MRVSEILVKRIRVNQGLYKKNISIDLTASSGQEVRNLMPGSYGIVKLIWRNEVV